MLLRKRETMLTTDLKKVRIYRQRVTEKERTNEGNNFDIV